MRTARRTFCRLIATATAIGAITAAIGLPARAQTWPSKPIILIVPFPPGGTSDTSARLVGQELSKQIGQPVVVENRPGANGNIGVQAAARAPADGHTIVLTGVGSNAINHGLYAKMPYDSRKDFAHITMIASGPNVLVVNAEFPAKTLKELVELVKANPGKYNYASNGNGSSGHVAMELFKQTADLRIDHIPYKGGGPAMTDVIGGQVPIYFTNQDAAMPHIKSGKLRALAVTSLERNPLYPDVPTIAELGYPGFQAISWTGLSAPAKTPKDIVARLHAETIKALQVPAVKERLESNGFVIGGNSSEDYAAFISAEIDKWTAVVRTAGATVD
jgi:tripartite-type tricarboxylate transporter receptor subunit TctC